MHFLNFTFKFSFSMIIYYFRFIFIMRLCDIQWYCTCSRSIVVGETFLLYLDRVYRRAILLSLGFYRTVLAMIQVQLAQQIMLTLPQHIFSNQFYLHPLNKTICYVFIIKMNAYITIQIVILINNNHCLAQGI